MTQEALKLTLEALQDYVDEYGPWSDDSGAQYVLRVGKEALAQHDSVQAKPESEQEPVAWGVDWGKAGDIPCVSIIKRVPNGGIEVMAVEYAPYSYTTPPQQEPVRIMGFNCKCGRRMEVSAEQGVVPAPQRKPLPAYEIVTMYDERPTGDSDMIAFARAIEAAHGIKENT